jgi:hypothetical protein
LDRSFTYCNARVTLADGQVCVFGGHDMQSQNGLFKVNLFDPETETWAPRAKPCTRDKGRGPSLFQTEGDPDGQDVRLAGQRPARPRGQAGEANENILVTPAGFEPAVSTLKGSRPGPG